MATGREGAFFPRTATYRSQGDRMPFSTTTSTFPRTVSLRPTTSRRPDTKLSGFGGFPTPFEIARSLVNKIAPEATKTLTQSLTMPRTATIGRRDTMAPATTSEGVDKEVPYISFAATVGRNSRFTGLTEDQMDELGGVEYRALRLLLYIVAGVSVGRVGLSEADSPVHLFPHRGCVHYCCTLHCCARPIRPRFREPTATREDPMVCVVSGRFGIFQHRDESRGSQFAPFPGGVPDELQ